MAELLVSLLLEVPDDDGVNGMESYLIGDLAWAPFPWGPRG